jgi:hypothetical protein
MRRNKLKPETIISACSLDQRFLAPCVDAARRVSERIQIVLWDSLFNGEPEAPGFIESVKSNFQGIAEVTVFPFDKEKDGKWHHNKSRWVGIQKSNMPWLLLLDADEIIDPGAYHNRLETGPGPWASISFASFWYFRSPRFRARAVERAGLLCQRAIWSEETAFNPKERYFLEGRREHAHGWFSHYGVPIIHHLSWVHTEAEMLKKTESWGHSGDKDWDNLIIDNMRKPFDVTKDKDFVHGYSYDSVTPICKLEGIE